MDKYLPKLYMPYIVVIIIILVIILYFNMDIHRENFYGEPLEYDIYNNDLDGTDGIFKEYKTINRYYPYDIWRLNELREKMWETRLPSLINQRYNYSDKVYSNKAIYNDILDVARLKELPLNLVNKYYTKIHPDIARTSLAYWPAEKPKYKAKKIYSSFRKLAPIMTYRNNIEGNTQNQNYDRSKTSLEYLLGANLIEQRREPIYKLNDKM